MGIFCYAAGNGGAALVITRYFGEDFGADVTLTLRVPVDSFDAFQNDLRELSAGKLQAEVIETKEMIVGI